MVGMQVKGMADTSQEMHESHVITARAPAHRVKKIVEHLESPWWECPIGIGGDTQEREKYIRTGCTELHKHNLFVWMVFLGKLELTEPPRSAHKRGGVFCGISQGGGVFKGGVFLVLVFCLWRGGCFCRGVFCVGAASASSYRHLEARGQERR
jgi:hypothetical protein